MKNLQIGWVQVVWGLLGFEPTEAQWPIIRKIILGVRFLLVCGGWRAGKSFVTSAICLLLMQPENLDNPEKSKPGLGWIIGPDYYQARAEFQYLHDALATGGMLTQVSMPANTTSPWSLTTAWNYKVETRTANDLTRLASFAPNWVMLAEAAQQPYESFLRARGRVMQSRGHVILSGTLEDGLPWYGDLLRQWEAPNRDNAAAFSLATWTNTAIFPGGWDDPEIQDIYRHHEENNIEDYFWEKYGAEPRKRSGLVLPEFSWTTHVKELQAQRDIPIELWIDPGKNCYCVLFVQVIGLTTYVLDRVYKRGGLAQDVIEQARSKPLWDQVFLGNPGTHGVIDIAGRQQQGMPSHIEIWRDTAGVVLRSNYVHQDVGRDVVRYRLQKRPDTGEPLLYFNNNMTNAKSADGTANDVLAEPELWVWGQQISGSSERRNPIDANNHAMKALGYGLYDKYGPTEKRKKPPPPRRRKYFKTL